MSRSRHRRPRRRGDWSAKQPGSLNGTGRRGPCCPGCDYCDRKAKERTELAKVTRNQKVFESWMGL